jgi:hypothetical protein
MAQDDIYRGDPPAGPQAPGGRAQYGPPPGYGYPPPGYGYPSQGYPGPWRRPTNGLAIGALVASLVFAPVGIVLGVMARKQIRQTGEEGDGLALAGIIIGSIVSAIYVLMILVMVIAFSAATSFGP